MLIQCEMPSVLLLLNLILHLMCLDIYFIFDTVTLPLPALECSLLLQILHSFHLRVPVL